jgi:hypothetical protein
MQTEYRIILTATFPDATSRDSAYDSLKTKLVGFGGPKIKRADMTKDEYLIPDVLSTTEKVV